MSIKLFLFVMVLSAFLIPGSFLGSNGVIAQQPDSSNDYRTPNYKQQMSLYQVYEPQNVKVVMLGNSLTHGANWNELLSRPNVVERHSRRYP